MERTELPTGPRGRVRLHDKPGPRVRLYDEVKATKRSKAKAHRVHLTEEKVAALPAKAKAYDVWDAGGRGAIRGLGIQVLPSGTKTYRYSFRFKGTPQAISYKLGRWPGLSLDEARKKAAAAERLVAKGQDPRIADPANSDASRTLSRPGTPLSRLDGCTTSPPTSRSIRAAFEQAAASSSHR